MIYRCRNYNILMQKGKVIMIKHEYNKRTIIVLPFFRGNFKGGLGDNSLKKYLISFLKCLSYSHVDRFKNKTTSLKLVKSLVWQKQNFRYNVRSNEQSN